MQFNTTSDYAIRTVLYLALNQNRCCTAKEIEIAMGVPARYLAKVTRKMKESCFLETVQGNGGGYRLLKKPEQISLYDILNLTEQTMEINGCLENELFCSRHATKNCPVRKVYSQINYNVSSALKAATISMLLGD